MCLSQNNEVIFEHRAATDWDWGGVVDRWTNQKLKCRDGHKNSLRQREDFDLEVGDLLFGLEEEKGALSGLTGDCPVAQCINGQVPNNNSQNFF